MDENNSFLKTFIVTATAKTVKLNRRKPNNEKEKTAHFINIRVRYEIWKNTYCFAVSFTKFRPRGKTPLFLLDYGRFSFYALLGCYGRKTGTRLVCIEFWRSIRMQRREIVDIFPPSHAVPRKRRAERVKLLRVSDAGWRGEKRPKT